MRTAKRKEIFHQPKTVEVLRCFEDEKTWCKLLLNRGKEYDDFLTQFISDGYYESNDKRTIKTMASDIGVPSSKLTKWITAIYNDLIELNENEPSLFKGDGILHELHFSYFDNRAYMSLWLPQSPKMYERFTFYFIKARMGTHMFWIKDVDHCLSNGQYSVTLWLEGGERNIYRELLVDRALFTGVLHFMDAYNKESYEIDKILLDWYKR